MILKPYKPYWPKTAIFWGAGATVSLGLFTTDQLAKAIWELAQRDNSIEERVLIAFGEYANEKYGSSIKNLLLLLGDSTTLDPQTEQDIIDEEYTGISEKDAQDAVRELREVYRWDVLKDVIHVCPQNSGDYVALQDLFTILDMHIHSGVGFRGVSGDDHSVIFFPRERLILAENMLKLLIIMMHTLAYYQLVDQNPEKLNVYQSFADELYSLMVEEAFNRLQEPIDLKTRYFYLFSHSLISMNWDPILQWQTFTAHEKRNNREDIAYIGRPALPLKLFHDLGHFMGVRQVNGEDPNVWYPFNETVVQRINDEDHVTGRRVRVGKLYFPHGSTSWRECPNCGKLIAYLGDNWGEYSKSLFPPLPLKKLNVSFEIKSTEEASMHDRGRVDAIQCPFCGSMTRIWNAPLVMQSAFKGFHSSFLEEIQRDMRVSLEHAEHIVLMGYGLPPDDIIYRSILAARMNREVDVKCSVVSFVYNEPDQWFSGQQLEELIKRVEQSDKKHPIISTIESVKSIFKAEHVRVNPGGIPNVFQQIGTNSADRSKIEKLLNWST